MNKVTCWQFVGGRDPGSGCQPTRTQLKICWPMTVGQLITDQRGKSSPLYTVTPAQHGWRKIRHVTHTCTVLSRDQNNLENTPRPQQKKQTVCSKHATQHAGHWKTDTLLRLPWDEVFSLFLAVATRRACKICISVATKKHRFLSHCTQSEGFNQGSSLVEAASESLFVLHQRLWEWMSNCGQVSPAVLGDFKSLKGHVDLGSYLRDL